MRDPRLCADDHHVHVLATPRHADSVSRMMQLLGRRYVRHVNAAYRRMGTLGRAAIAARRSITRPISSPAAAISSSIPCAPAWSSARDYLRSSYRSHAFGEADSLVAIIPSIGRSGRPRRIVSWPIARCSARRSRRALSTRCAAAPNGDRRNLSLISLSHRWGAVRWSVPGFLCGLARRLPKKPRR